MIQNSFFALLSRMKLIRRWGLMRNTREENLAEHSLDVAVLTHALAVLGNRRLGKQYDVGRAVLCALYHDCPEILTGDLPTPVKYYSPELRGSYRVLEQAAGERLLVGLPGDIRPDYRACLQDVPEELNRLVKAADKLAALQKCAEETGAGNREFSRALDATRQSLELLDSPEAELYLAEFFPAFSQTLDAQIGPSAGNSD